ncbi:MAG TPA: class I SAM-dependent methyltransferase [Pyrinomonadaceae bacterium]|nr:class I SAM-dependent methyltransferase [Pyrinomonadaceae bacterium]
MSTANAESQSPMGAIPNFDEDKLNQLVEKIITDYGACLSTALVYIGERLGIYKAMADGKGYTSQSLSEKTGLNERYLREWLLNQAAGGYIEYDPESKQYSLNAEQTLALAKDETPFYLAGGVYVAKALFGSTERIMNAFLNGGGMLWGEHDPELFKGTEQFFRAGYQAYLVANWIPALKGVKEKLEAGGVVADVGCGHGASTLIMAETFPNSRFYGFDNHLPSIEYAQKKARESGLTNIEFIAVDAGSIPDNSYDLICFFDCLHDMGDPLSAMKRAYQTLKSDGSCMIVEPMAGNNVEDNLNPVGRIFSAASTLCCTSNSLALGGPALGAVASEQELEKYVKGGGFTSFERVSETISNRIFEARK